MHGGDDDDDDDDNDTTDPGEHVLIFNFVYATSSHQLGRFPLIALRVGEVCMSKVVHMPWLANGTSHGKMIDQGRLIIRSIE